MDNPSKQYYNLTYGTNASMTGIAEWLWDSSAWNSKYNWTFAGPWDPPEHNVSIQTVQVETSEPYTSVVNNTMYWGFDGEVNITLSELSGGSTFAASDVVVYIFDDDGENVTAQFAAGTNGLINTDNAKQGYIYINMTEWGKNNAGSSFADNGTWFAYIFVDVNTPMDRDLGGANAEWTEEWNATVEWEVVSGPTAQWKWIDDDGDVWNDANYDGVIPYIPGVANVPLDVEFKVYDSSGNAFGDLATGSCVSVKECAENITISGNSLFTGTLDKIPGYGLSTTTCGYSGGVWSIPIIPTMSVGGGAITITVTAYNSTATGTLSIGGTNYGTNGTVVTVEPNSFKIDQQNQTLTVTVKNSESGNENLYGIAYLYYIDDGTITAANACKPIADHWVAYDHGTGGYTIPFNTTQQTTNQTNCGADSDNSFAAAKAPRNLTVYIAGPFAHDDGYALVQMEPVNDLEVEVSQETMMAGYAYDDFTISCTFAGNSTDTPSTETADKNNFHIKIYDENDADVTNTLLNGIDASDLTGSNAYSFEFNNVYATTAGTYTIFAYNNTHNSKGHNATLVVKPVDVVCDKDPFIWGSDNNISATFTITYNGSPVNGTLLIDNMTDVGDYNKTWKNCSFNGISSYPGGNTSLKIKSNKIVDGVITVHDITANYLAPNEAKQYITFWFKPTQTSSAYAKASVQMQVQVPGVTPSPQYIPLGRTTKVYCGITGRDDASLSSVFVRLHGCGFDKNSTSDVDGRASFSISPSATGNISIDVGESGRTLSDTVVYVTSWVLDVATDVSTVNEEGTFTVTVMKEGTTEYVADADVTFNGVTTKTDENGQVTFTAPSVTSDRDFAITAAKEGFAPEPNTVSIRVTNTPGLKITVSSETKDEGGNFVAPATVTVSNEDTGALITGATVTYTSDEGAETDTTVNGQITITTAGTYTITASFGTFDDAPSVTATVVSGAPGFELITLIAALGVAFILLRRRK